MLILALTALVLAACDSGAGSQTGSNPTVAPTSATGGVSTPAMGGSSTPVTSNIPDEVTYIDNMIPHHRRAVDMAKIAQEKATRSELKSLANDIILTQEDEIGKLGALRAEIAGSATPAPQMIGGMGGMGGMDTDLDKLKASTSFDRDFITAMIPHHQSAIDMSKAALPILKNAALLDLANNIITAQQGEIDKMKAWLQEWK